ncbi:MAG: hypothetical protein Q9174_006088 [Haloplaca sp. 1 TL-2023]
MALDPATGNASRKRKAESDATESGSHSVTPAVKKTTASKDKNPSSAITSTKTTYSYEELAAFSHDELASYTFGLQNHLNSKREDQGNVKKVPVELPSQDLPQRAEDLRNIIKRMIRKSMTWKPACKTGDATFSQEFTVPAESIFVQLFKPGNRGWKTRKLSAERFERIVGQIDTSHGSTFLVLTNDVTVSWDGTTGSLRCSGKYGKMAAAKSALAEYPSHVSAMIRQGMKA